VANEALEQNPAFYNEKPPEFPTAKKLADVQCWKLRWFLDENSLTKNYVIPAKAAIQIIE
jgi:hypothetical protein